MKPESKTHGVGELSDNHLGTSMLLPNRCHHPTSDFRFDGVHLNELRAEKGAGNHGGELRRDCVGNHLTKSGQVGNTAEVEEVGKTLQPRGFMRSEGSGSCRMNVPTLAH